MKFICLRLMQMNLGDWDKHKLQEEKKEENCQYALCFVTLLLILVIT